MAYRYNRINWQNKPNVVTPISAENLNKMDKGIDDNDKAIGDLAQLNTSNKSSLVSGLNELNDKLAQTSTKSGSSFSAIESGYLATALDSLVATISSKSSGIIQLESGGGPVFHAILCKYSDLYFSGFVLSYLSNTVFFFRYQAGTCFLRRLTL